MQTISGWKLCVVVGAAVLLSWLATGIALAVLEQQSWASPGPSAGQPEPAPHDISALLEEAKRITRDAAEE